MMKNLFTCWILVCAIACSPKLQPEPAQPISYLALGDSYTIGESVPQDGRWPNQLAASLNQQGVATLRPQILATTGWTTIELMDGINSAVPNTDYDLVSLLIGVNDQYRGYSIAEFEGRFEALVLRSIAFAKNRAERVFVLSIPDYSVTEFASSLDTKQIAIDIDAYNALKQKVCQKYNIQYFDITAISRLAKDDLSLIAEDQLHPSAVMYKQWVEEISEVIVQMLQ